MTIYRKRITAVLFVLAICGTSVSRSMGQQTSSPRTQPPGIIKYDGDMAGMLKELTNIYGVPIGLEVDPLQPKSQVGFYLRDPTLSDVLNAITQSAPKYHWRASDGSMEVLPLKGSSPLLDTIISNFQVNDVDETQAINLLVNLPEVQASMRAMSLTSRTLVITSTESKVEKFSISLEGVTMRQALHKIVNESGGRFWTFRTYSDGSFSISNSSM